MITKERDRDDLVRRRKSMDRSIFWCATIFGGSTLTLAAFAIHAFREGKVALFLHSMGVIYLLLSLIFLAVVAVVFVYGHVASAQEIEAPKLDLFDREELR